MNEENVEDNELWEDPQGEVGSGPVIDFVEPHDEALWNDPQNQLGSSPVIGLEDPEEQRHQRTMQAGILWGLAGAFGFTLVIVVGALSLGKIEQEFASELAQMIIPPLLASTATIIGVLFVIDKKT